MASEYRFRRAERGDLEALVAMLADDALGNTREAVGRPLHENYATAFRTIEDDPNNELIVCELAEEIVGMLQITYIPYLTYVGSWRALIEGVRVCSARRGEGIGRRLFEWAIQRAKEKRCRIIQLTTDKTRPDAIRFYERLGFKPSHEGMKLWLE